MVGFRDSFLRLLCLQQLKSNSGNCSFHFIIIAYLSLDKYHDKYTDFAVILRFEATYVDVYYK